MWNSHFQRWSKCNIHKIGLMLRDAVGYTWEEKTAQETGESWGTSRNHWEIRGKFRENWWILGEIQGKFRGNWWISGEIGGGEILGKSGENWWIVLPQWWNRLWNQAVKLISPTSGKRGENKGELFHKNSPQWNLCETGGGNEREFRFHDQFQLHSTIAWHHIRPKHVFLSQWHWTMDTYPICVFWYKYWYLRTLHILNLI